jgi:hypothetical protein
MPGLSKKVHICDGHIIFEQHREEAHSAMAKAANEASSWLVIVSIKL